MGSPGDSGGKESACDVKDLGLILGSGRSSGEGNWLPSPVFLPGASHGQGSLAGYSPWDGKESDMTEACTSTQGVVQGAENLTG